MASRIKAWADFPAWSAAAAMRSFMGIDSVGFQGQIFDEKVIAKIKEVKKIYPELTIQIDGGVNLETAPLLKAAGADRLVIGSAIFESENIVEAIEKFKVL